MTPTAVLPWWKPKLPSARMTRRRGDAADVPGRSFTLSSLRETIAPPGRRPEGEGWVGTAYRIRTGDLRLERAVSWASRRMRLRTATTDSMSRPDRDDSNGPRSSPPGDGTGRGLPARPPGLQAVDLQEATDRVRDLLVALLADDQPVVRMRPERLVLG